MKTAELNLKQIAELMGVLGVESRLRIVTLLRDCGALCVNALACRLDITQSAVSQHLRILHLYGLVTSHKDGYYTHYHLEKEILDSSLKMLNQLSVKQEPVIQNSKCKPKGDKICANVAANANTRKN